MLTHTDSRIKSHVTNDQIDQFKRDGFVVLRGVVCAEEIEQINQLITSLFKQFNKLPKKLAYDMSECPYPVNKLRNPQIARCLRLEPTLVDTEYIQNATEIARKLLGSKALLSFDHAILKPAYTGSSTPWHQDEAYDRPTKQRLNFWLPLQDVSIESGCLQYIPGSHKKELLPHHPLARGSKALITEQVKMEQAVACPVKAGDLVIHGGRTLHYAGSNITSTNRLAWILVFAVIDKSPYARITRFASRALHKLTRDSTMFSEK